MTPSSFTFRLTVPSDPNLAAIVAEIARHAAEYADLKGAAVDEFVEQARGAALKALKAAPGPNCVAVFAAADGQLNVTIGAETISQPLS